MIRENLLPAHRVEARRVSRVARFWAMSLSAGLIVVAFGGVGTQLATRTPRAMPVGHQSQRDGAKAELAAVKAELSALERAHAAGQRAMDVPDWGALLAVLARESAGRVALQAIRAQPAGDGAWSVSLVGHADDRQRVLEWRAALESTGLLDGLRSGVTPDAAGLGGVDFHLDGQIAPGATP